MRIPTGRAHGPVVGHLNDHSEFLQLPRNGDPELFLRVDEVVMIIVAKIELKPGDLARELAAARSGPTVGPQ